MTGEMVVTGEMTFHLRDVGRGHAMIMCNWIGHGEGHHRSMKQRHKPEQHG